MTESELAAFLNSSNHYLPQISIDCVVFGFHDNQLKILLLKMKGLDVWSLPGGYIPQDEDVETAAMGILEERTGLKEIYLEQFGIFGKKERYTKPFMESFFKKNNIQVPENHWTLQRFVSIGYYALVDFSKVNPTLVNFTEDFDWYEINKLPNLAFDHDEIIPKALQTLQLMLDHKLVGFNLLGEVFTMIELQSLYETILGTKLRRNNFQRKMLSLGILERVEKLYTGAANKAPYLYKFNDKVKNTEH